MLVRLVSAAMLAVTAMHEVHQQAGQKQQVRQYPKQVRAMLGNEKERSDRQKSQEHPT